MSYVVLARKYRPRTFEQMVGQDHVVRALTHALEQGRLHHAYLFTGTRGIGKTTVSRILAKSLNCTGPDGQGGITAHPCGVCTACTEIDGDRFIDYIELDAASNRSIDEIRDLIERAAYKPSVGRYKVFMIDEAHQLTKDAFNALLKTLEEPPEYLKFVLATTDPEKMLPTVLSRCLQFNLRPMAPETVASHLQQVLGSENIPFDAGSLRLLSRGARGSMRDALSLTDQAIAYGAGMLEESAVRAMLGTVDRSHANRIVESLARRDAGAMLGEVNALRGLGLSAAGTLEEVARLLQQMAVEQALPGSLDASDSDTEAARTLAALMAPDETQLLYSIAVHGRAELSLAPDEYAGLVMVLLRFMAFPSDGGGSGGGGGSTPPAARQPDGPRAAAPVAAASPVAAPRPAAAPASAPVAAAPVASATTPAVAARPAPAPVAPAPAAPLLRTPPARAVATATVSDDDGPPWADEEPDELLDDLPAPTRGRNGNPPPPVQRARPSLDELEPEYDDEPAPRQAAPQGVAPPPALPPFERTELGTRWYALIGQCAEAGKLIAMVRALAMQSELVHCDADGEAPIWRLRVNLETLRNPALADKLGAILRELTGQNLQLVVEMGDPQDTPLKRDAAEADRRQRAAIDEIQSDATVRALLAQFQTARILPGSVKPL
ncbi:DNA polymerase III subunit gamma/tau [Scleromatobacter humisilvae]|uniref:DNA polymerase III subunit gamma/tau n=1 Tax=Scleromatobacter humisilvae TaxID=2897159 RepID=A0A9X2BZ59_9BURK|nr:DNA polymerase III subunit gamma/tau [Scleromatobacter humisilvae]MCK9685997.1 DNA polymerase III subunit gamma/tau [Scleromatobacter humisilvae]